MARMHARRKGKSSSHRPTATSSPEWVTLSPAEIEEIVVFLTKEGNSTSVIGMKLRDQYGIPNVTLATGKSITQILKANNMDPSLPEDLSFLMKKSTGLHRHMQENPKDLHNRRGLELLESKIRRLVKYYKSTGVLPEDWKYSIKTAKLQVE